MALIAKEESSSSIARRNPPLPSSRTYRNCLGPKGLRSRDFIAAATFRLEHRLGEYNAVQKAAYLGVLCLVAIMILSGIAIWKPVQSYPLELLFGGFQGARLVHFIVMAGIVLFILVHVGLTLIVPRTLLAMVVGRATEPRHIATSEKA